MFLLTRKTDYALVAMTHLARQGAALASAREISEWSGAPLPVLMNILNALAHHGLVTSTRGVKGGYRLARPAERITLVHVIEAIEGPLRLAVCAPAGSATNEFRCSLEAFCVAKGPVRRVHDRLRRFLSEVTLAEIAADPEAGGLEPATVGSGAVAHGQDARATQGEDALATRAAMVGAT